MCENLTKKLSRRASNIDLAILEKQDEIREMQRALDDVNRLLCELEKCPHCGEHDVWHAREMPLGCGLDGAGICDRCLSTYTAEAGDDCNRPNITWRRHGEFNGTDSVLLDLHELVIPGQVWVFRHRESGEILNPSSFSFSLSPWEIVEGAKNWDDVFNAHSEIDLIDGYERVRIYAAIQ